MISEEGNRRFIPFHLTAKMDIDLLRQEKDQIWAEVVELERIGREKYEAEMRSKNIPIHLDDEVYPDIMLEEQHWVKAAALQNQAKKKTGYEDWLSTILFWPDIYWDEKWCTISVFSGDIKTRLGIPDYNWNREAQKIARVMKGKVELRITENGIPIDAIWTKTDSLKKGDNKVPLNGYIIQLTGDIGRKAYQELRKRKEDWDKKIGLF